MFGYINNITSFHTLALCWQEEEISKPVFSLIFCLCHPVYYLTTLYIWWFFTGFIIQVKLPFRIYILLHTYNVNFLRYSALITKGAHFLKNTLCNTNVSQVKKCDLIHVYKNPDASEGGHLVFQNGVHFGNTLPICFTLALPNVILLSQ
jgi:hypothetical protein